MNTQGKFEKPNEGRFSNPSRGYSYDQGGARQNERLSFFNESNGSLPNTAATDRPMLHAEPRRVD